MEARPGDDKDQNGDDQHKVNIIKYIVHFESSISSVIGGDAA
jgi:hypothetical protein